MAEKSYVKNWMVQIYLMEFVLQILEVQLDNCFMNYRNFCERGEGSVMCEK